MKTLRDALKEGLVAFSYTKKDGSLRNAVGTLNPQEIARSGYNKTADEIEREVRLSETYPNRYFDIGFAGWRTINDLESVVR